MGIAGEGRSRGFGEGQGRERTGWVGSGRVGSSGGPSRLRDGLAGSSRHTLAAGVCRGGAGWAVSRHCPALLAALWVVVAALQEWCSWEEVPPFRSPPARRETHDTRHGTRNFTTKLPRTTVGTGGLQPALFAGRQDSRRISISDSIRPSLTVLHLPTYLPWPRRE